TRQPLNLCSSLGLGLGLEFDYRAGCFTDLGTHEASVLWRRSFTQSEQVTSNKDLPIPMENPYKEPLRRCVLCKKRVDYKSVQLWSQFISPFTGCSYGRHITGLSIKRAQKMGFVPVTYKDPAYLKDPRVCNIRYQE
uniref:28S ribosomal protein S18b, mitochondrial n=1 Tax=Mus spicilegus TaxID=10103 RepID=A0A8C6IK36_MUSSI